MKRSHPKRRNRRARLGSMVARVALLVAALAISFCYIAASVRLYSIDRSAARADLTTEQTRELARKLPWSAELALRHGASLFFVEQEWETGRDELRRATELNRFDARYWLALAHVNVALSDADEQRRALAAALAADPTTPSVSWSAALMYSTLGEQNETLRVLSTVMRHDPERREQAFDLAERLTSNVETLIANHLPTDADVLLAFLLRKAKEGDLAAAQATFAKLMSTQAEMDPSSLSPYFDLLLARDELRSAWSAWREVVARNGTEAAYVGDAGVVNGGFENRITSTPFDWRTHARPGVEIVTDASEFRSGTRSLLVRYQGRPTDVLDVEQTIPVKPSRRYVVKAFAKVREMSSASGPRLVVDDVRGKSRLFISEDLLGTSSWREIGGEFTTSETTTSVRLYIARVPGKSEATGQVWLDDFSLHEAGW